MPAHFFHRNPKDPSPDDANVQSFVAVDTKGKVLSIAINVKWWSEQGVLYGIYGAIWCYIYSGLGWENRKSSQA